MTTMTRPTAATTSDDVVLDRMAADLCSGTYFQRHATASRSARGYRPPLTRSAWSHAMTTIARMASQSDAFAQIAAGILGRVNLYGTRPEAAAQVYEAAAAVLADGFDDVIGRSGPEPGRFSDHQRDFTLAERISLAYWLAEATAPMVDCVPSVGWVVTGLAARHRVRTTDFPSLIG